MKSPILVALFDPVSLALLALSVAAGACSAWWLFPIGLLFWAVMVLRIVGDPGLQISHEIDSRTPLAPRFQAKFDRIQKIQINLYNTVNFSSPATKRAFQPIQRDLKSLVDQAYQFCLRISALENYRAVSDAKENLEDEWVELSRKVASATDQVAKAEYSQSLSAMENRMVKRKQLATFLDQAEAQITSLANTLDELLAEALRLSALGANEIKKSQQAFQVQIKQAQGELFSFDARNKLAADNGAITQQES